MKQRHAASPPPAEADLKRLQHELEVHQAELELQNQTLLATQAELETALVRYTDLYDFAPVGYLTLGPGGEIRQLNFTAATILGAERSRLVNRCLGQFVGRADRSAFGDFLGSVFNGPSQACEVTLSPQAAGPPLAVRIEANRTSSGQECRAVLTNISERKRVEEQLRETTQRLKLANDAASIGTWSWNFSDGKLEWDQRLCDWYEAPEAGRQGKLDYDFWRSRVHPDDAAQAEAALLESRRRDIPCDHEFRIVRTDGSVRYVHSAALIQHDASGQPLRMIGINRDITERKLTEAELDKIKVRLEQLAEQSRTFTWEVNAAGLFTYVSQETERILGYRPEELVGWRHFYDLHPETGREEFKQAAFAGLERNEPFMGLVDSVLTKDGRRLWVSTNGIPLLNPDGTLRGCQGSYTDITERKLAEDEVRRQAALISSLLDAIPDVVFLKNTAGVYLGCNPAFVELVGRPRNEIVGKTDHELFAPEVADAFREEDRQMLATRELRHNEEWVSYPGGRKALFDTLKTPYWGPDGESIGVFGISHDITERKQTEFHLAQRMKELQAVYGLAEITHRDGLGLEDIYREFVNTLPASWLHPEVACARLVMGDREFRSSNFKPCAWVQSAPLMVKEAAVGRVEVGYLEEQPLMDEGPFLKEERKLINMLAIQIGNLTQRRHAEKEVRRQAALVSSLLDAIPDIVFLKNTAGVYLACNPAFVEFIGRPRNEIVGKTDHDFFDPEVADAFREHDRQMLAGRKLRHNEEWVTYADGRRALLYTLKTPYLGSDGEPIGVLGISHDITERKREEEAVRSALAEKTVLLKEVHHRVKNNLQVVISLLNLQSNEALKGDVRDILASTRNRVRSMALIHENLYRSESLARLNLGSYLEGLCAHLLRSAGPVGARVRLESQVESERISIGLNQAVPCGLLVNELVTNALKHAFPGERVGLIRVTFQSPTPQEVLLTVVDDGVGLPAALEPQQTESLGLQLVCLLTEQLHGTVTFERGRGTAVRILFPNAVDTETAYE